MSQNLKVAIIGYGKMGKEIERIALARGHKVACLIDREEDWALFPGESNVAFEFSEPNSAFANVLRCFDAGIPVVSGTTGWYSGVDEAKQICLQKGKTLVYAPNYSLGVNVFFEVNRLLAKLLSPFPDYKPKISEIHHTQKLDAPSGTAVALANGIIEQNNRFRYWELVGEQTECTQIPIVAHRIDDVKGTHLVSWQGPNDFIEIHHKALDRSIFAEGAVFAAERVLGKQGFFSLKDLLNF